MNSTQLDAVENNQKSNLSTMKASNISSNNFGSRIVRCPLSSKPWLICSKDQDNSTKSTTNKDEENNMPAHYLIMLIIFVCKIIPQQHASNFLQFLCEECWEYMCTNLKVFISFAHYLRLVFWVLFPSSYRTLVECECASKLFQKLAKMMLPESLSYCVVQKITTPHVLRDYAKEGNQFLNDKFSCLVGKSSRIGLLDG